MTSFPVLFDTEIINGQILSTLVLISSSLEVPPTGGFGEDEMASRLKVKEVIKNCDKITLELEDDDLATVKECISTMKWSVLSAFIHAFVISFK